MPRLLLVDDEEPLRLSLSYQLAKEGFTVATAADGPEGLNAARWGAPDVVLLDVMLPGLDGLDVCRQIREFSDVPILLLTAKDNVTDKVGGFDCGADDYVTKPFNTRELIARLGAVMRRGRAAQKLLAEDRELVRQMEELLRRRALPLGDEKSTGAGAPAHGVITAGPVSIDLDRAEVKVNEASVALSPPEYGLLCMLLAYRGRVVTRTELTSRVWGSPSREALMMLDAHMRCLREKIEPDPSRPRWLVTIPGIGFQYT